MKGFTMAKSNSLVDAIQAAINMEAIKVDVSLNPDEKQAAVNEQLAVIADSDFSTLGAMGDELINIREQANEILGDAGIDPQQFRTDNALAGVRAAAAAATADNEDPDDIEQE
jgi:hypothetical protein